MKKFQNRLVISLLTFVLFISTAISISCAATKASVKLSKTTLALEEGASKKLKVKTTGISKVVSTKWSSDNAEVASVTKKGAVTANEEGSANIQCIVKYKKKAASKTTKKTLTCQVTVTPVSSADDTPDGSALTATYGIHIQGDDWGCGVDKAILSLSDVVDSVSAKDFTVQETKQAMDWTTFTTNEGTFDRQVTDAYLCDADGNKVTEPSKYVAIEMYISPNDGSPFLYENNINVWSDPYYLTINLADGAALTSAGKDVSAINVTKEPTGKTTNADDFAIDSFTATNGTSYKYALYTPKQETKTMVVWLHGMGEGGTDRTDPTIALLGAEVTQLAGETFQNMMNGAYILAPQCPTYWMDNDGKRGNATETGGIAADGTSFYTESLHELIADSVKKTGAEKVLITGCSNGGYMTLVLALTYKDEYDGYVPVCEAVPDESIKEEQLKEIKDLPLYFIYSKDDNIVDPTKHEQPTIDRLKKLGASNLHVATTENVTDTSGRFKQEDGSPYAYMGHFSWVHFFNNESVCDEHQEGAWQWMADLVKK